MRRLTLIFAGSLLIVLVLLPLVFFSHTLQTILGHTSPPKVFAQYQGSYQSSYEAGYVTQGGYEGAYFCTTGCNSESAYQNGYQDAYQGGYQVGYQAAYQSSYQGSYQSSYQGAYQGSYQGSYESAYESGYSGPTPVPTPTPPPCSTPSGKCPPTATLTGPTSLTPGQAGTYVGHVSDTNVNLALAILYVEGPNNPSPPQQWTPFGLVGCSGGTCTVTQNWTQYLPGTYTIAVYAENTAGQVCSGNPYYTSYGSNNIYQCDPADNNADAYLNVTVGTATPSPSPTPSTSPTPTPTPQPVGACGSPLCLEGNFIAIGGVTLARPAASNNVAPAEEFTERPDFYVTIAQMNQVNGSASPTPNPNSIVDQLIQQILVSPSYSWQEIAP